jgi:capsule polysaccharide export protein KpsE/RkpR
VSRNAVESSQGTTQSDKSMEVQRSTSVQSNSDVIIVTVIIIIIYFKFIIISY